MVDKNQFAGIDRRSFVSSLAAGAGIGFAGKSGLAAGAGLDLDDTDQNLQALLKLQADLSGAEVISGMPGEVYSWVPGEGNFRLFDTYGVGVSRVERAKHGWRLHYKEAVYYTDPQTGQVMDRWDNPFTGRQVAVEHLRRARPSRLYARDLTRWSNASGSCRVSRRKLMTWP